MKDLEEEQFFSLDDVKPGDNGQHHISLHLDDNPGWACMVFANGVDEENTHLDVEQDAGDTSANEGELRESVEVVGWHDTDNNHTFDSGDEVQTEIVELDLVSTEPVTLPIADSQYGQEPFAATTTQYFDMYWCVGEIATTSGGVQCNGAGADNTAQTDSLTADVSIYTEQARNNADFTCDAVTWEDASQR